MSRGVLIVRRSDNPPQAESWAFFEVVKDELRPMPTLILDDVKPGMTLAQPVYTHQDRLLLEAGRRISEKHLRIFKSWGVAAVAVKGSAAGDGSTSKGAEVPATGIPDDAFRARFAGVLDDPVMVAIMEAAARHLAGRIRKRKVRHGRS